MVLANAIMKRLARLLSKELKLKKVKELKESIENHWGLDQMFKKHTVQVGWLVKELNMQAKSNEKSQLLDCQTARLTTPQYQMQSKSPKLEDVRDIQQFLDHVVAGAQPKAEAMLKVNRDLALASGTVTDHAKRTFKNITGLQYAVWALDWHMWEMIRKYLPLKAVCEQASGFEQGLWVAEHGEHFKGWRLIEALSNANNAKDYLEKMQYWQRAGELQRLLPMHILQEYNQPGQKFSSYVYPYEDNPERIVEYPIFNNQYELVRDFPRDLLNKLGTKGTLYRGEEENGAILNIHPPEDYDYFNNFTGSYYTNFLSDETSAISRLLNIREQQRKNLKISLNKAEIKTELRCHI